MPNPSTFPLATVVAHERLMPRVAALLRQADRLPPRQRGRAVSEVVLGVARAVFAEGRFVLGRSAPALPETLSGDDLAVLCAELGAALEGFEASQVRPDARGVIGWALTDGSTRPVLRHLKHLPHGTPLAPPIPTEQQQREAAETRKKLLIGFMAREDNAYDDGYRDGKNGAPHRPPPDYPPR